MNETGFNKEEMLENKNLMFDHERSNALVIDIFDKCYNPNVKINNNTIHTSVFDDINFSDFGLNTEDAEDSAFINQFDHLLFMMNTSSGFMLNLKNVVKRANHNFNRDERGLRIVKDKKMFAKTLRQLLDKELEKYENKNGSSLKLDLLRLFGLPIKDESFTITIEVDGESVTL